MNNDKFSSVVCDLYDAALQPEGWDLALKRVIRLLNSDVGGIVLQNRTSGAARIWRAHGADQSAVRAYEDYYGRISPIFRDTVSRPTGILYTDEMYPDYDAYVRSEIYNDYFIPNGMAHLVQTQRPGDTDTVLTVLFRRGGGSSFYDEELKRRFLVVEHHIRRAYALTERLAETDAKAQATIAVLDKVNTGVVLVDETGRVFLANTAAEGIFQLEDGLFIRHGRLATGNSAETDILRKLIFAAALFSWSDGTKIDESQPGGDMAVSRPSGRRSLLLSVTPFRYATLNGMSGGAAAMITIADPSQRAVPVPQILADLFGLTPAEARLAAEMTTGDSLERIAERLGLTRESARTTLKRVYAKTDTHRQAELVRLLLSMPRTAEPRG